MTKKELKKKQFAILKKKLEKSAPHSKKQWGLWCKKEKKENEREQVIIEAILVQRTDWRNAEKAVNNLKEAGYDTLKKISSSDAKTLAKLIKPSGCYNSKARYLFELARLITERYANISEMMTEELVVLRRRLLGVKGIGFETADSILLYALDKPTFVVDEYTRRLAAETWPASAFPGGTVPLIVTKNLYLYLKNIFEEELEKNFRIYQDIHAAIVIYGKKENKSKKINAQKERREKNKLNEKRSSKRIPKRIR